MGLFCLFSWLWKIITFTTFTCFLDFLLYFSSISPIRPVTHTCSEYWTFFPSVFFLSVVFTIFDYLFWHDHNFLQYFFHSQGKLVSAHSIYLLLFIYLFFVKTETRRQGINLIFWQYLFHWSIIYSYNFYSAVSCRVTSGCFCIWNTFCVVFWPAVIFFIHFSLCSPLCPLSLPCNTT